MPIASGDGRWPRRWPAPEDPDHDDDDTELDGRDLICAEVGRLRQCVDWLVHPDTKRFPMAVNLRPEADHPDTAHVVVVPAPVAEILPRIAAEVDESARARRLSDLDGAAVRTARRGERRRRAAEPDSEFREFCRRKKLPQSERSWDAYAAERRRRGETDTPFHKGYNSFRRDQWHVSG